jgi:hypothetical protein
MAPHTAAPFDLCGSCSGSGKQVVRAYGSLVALGYAAAYTACITLTSDIIVLVEVGRLIFHCSPAAATVAKVARFKVAVIVLPLHFKFNSPVHIRRRADPAAVRGMNFSRRLESGMAVQQRTASNGCVWHVHCELASCMDPSFTTACVWYPLMSMTCSDA